MNKLLVRWTLETIFDVHRTGSFYLLSVLYRQCLLQGMRVVRRHDDRAVAIVDRFHAHEATPFAVAQISDGIAGLLSRIPYHGLRCALLGDNDGALQHGVAQLKRIRRIVDAVNHALEGHRFITLVATGIAVQYGIEIIGALQPAHLRLFGVSNLQIRMQCLFVRQWLVSIVIYGKRHRQLTADFNGVNGMKLRIRSRNKLGKYICVDLAGIQCIAQQGIGRTFLVIMPEAIAAKPCLGFFEATCPPSKPELNQGKIIGTPPRMAVPSLR